MAIISTGYIPRPWFIPIHLQRRRRNISVIHRRAGKTVGWSNDQIDKIARFDRNCPLTGKPLRDPHAGYMATTIGQAKAVAWDYYKYYTKNFPGVKCYENDLIITYNHPRGKAHHFLFGADNFDAKRGVYFDDLMYDEFQDMHPDVRDKVFLPTLEDREGSETISGTPKGDNRFKELFYTAMALSSDPNSEWFAILQNIYQTGVFNPAQIEKMKKEYSDEAWRQEFLCDFNAAPSGHYYQKYMDELASNGRIRSVPHDPSYAVTTSWDLGVSDSLAIWFHQEVGNEIRVIDYYEEHGKGLPEHLKILHAKPYNYNMHIFPHDVCVRELQSGKSRLQFLNEQGLKNIEYNVRTESVAEDIEIVRRVLPMCYFDATKCAKGISALRSYERKWDTLKKSYAVQPLHNWASNGADAFRTFAIAYRPGFGRHWGALRNDLPEVADSQYDLFN